LPSNKSPRSCRGFTLVEMLTALVIVGVVLSMALAIAVPMFQAPQRQAAKLDTLQAASSGLYAMQDDLRKSDSHGIWACTTSPVVCARPGTASATTPALVIITPVSANQPAPNNVAVTWDSSGAPAWTGVQVYWIAANPSGGTDLHQDFVPNGTLGSGSTGAQNNLTQTIAQQAVTTALAATGTRLAAPHASQLSVSVNSGTRVIGLILVAHSTEGARQNQTTFQSDTFARN
jgi:prepilin-type N-terminal cleavage/methylation domain-containing protein